MLLFGGYYLHNRQTRLASVKGIIITAIIAAGIIGASIVIWYIPQSGNNRSNGINITDKEGATADVANLPADNLSFVYTQHNLATADVENSFDKWRQGVISNDEMNTAISKARAELDMLRKRVDTPGVPQQWQQAYSTYSQALGKFGTYLDDMKKIVEANDKRAISVANSTSNNNNNATGANTTPTTSNYPELDAVRSEMKNLTEKAIKLFPT